MYVRIINTVDGRIREELGWNTPNWRVENACRVCCYKVMPSNLYSYSFLTFQQLRDEPPMLYSRLWAHDGNNSLKRMLPVGGRVAADTRVLEDSDYFLPRTFVNDFANEVKKSGEPKRHREIRSEGRDSDSEDEEDLDVDEDDSPEGDPTDGAHDTMKSGVDHCVKNWKAAASDEKKRSWAIFDETGIYASACRHRFILWICDMVRSGEL